MTKEYYDEPGFCDEHEMEFELYEVDEKFLWACPYCLEEFIRGEKERAQELADRDFWEQIPF